MWQAAMADKAGRLFATKFLEGWRVDYGTIGRNLKLTIMLGALKVLRVTVWLCTGSLPWP